MESFVGEVVLTEHVDVSPSHWGMCYDGAAQVFPGFGVRGLLELAGQVEITPADDAVFDEAVAGLGGLLLLFLGLGKLSGIANSDGTGEVVREFDLVELPLDGLPQGEIIDIAQDEQRLDDLPEGFQGLVERVLARIRIEPPEDVGGCVLLEFDRGDQA